MYRSVALAAPLVVAVLAGFGAAFALSGFPPLLNPFLAGAAGWIVALALRAPVGLAGMRVLRDPARVQTVVTASSGPLEESVRLVVVVLVGRDVGAALWLGLGWAAVEAVYAIVNAFALAHLSNRTDPEAEAARAFLPPAALAPSAPWWGLIERAMATAVHVGFTLIVAALPAAVLLTALAHSAVNISFLAMLRRYPTGGVMAVGAVVGAVTLVIGLAMHGAI